MTTAGRKPLPPAEQVGPTFVGATPPDMAAQEIAVRTVLAQQDARVTALAQQLNYQGSTDPDVLENSARDAIRRIGMATFELGGYLLLLKEACPHGEFIPKLVRLKLEQRAARQYMQVTRRFANRQTSADLNAIGVSKLTEMLVLDDEQLEELTDLGQTGELALDDVASMSVRELRAAIRETRAERDADQKVIQAKNETIDRLQRDVARIAAETPDQTLADLKKAGTSAANDAEGAVMGGLRAALKAITEHAQEQGDPPGRHGVFMAGLVGQVVAQLRALCDEFQLPDVSNAADLQLAAEMAEWDK